ncbi:helix-turn-helix domain-containing protein [Lactobacillus paragasseri]|uniref:helix-turn-helix domain-containing protein n=1 Tax=Lactobacillus paragasseri TaxID=2107999 RepID=UPI003974B0D8|nr:helix-turn-helix domain-containing protein [Lactobacillus paragasseri]
MAKKLGYDKAYLGKLIIKNTNHSFNYLRNYYRIHNSCQLLQFTDYSIEKISIKTGYSSPNHYERCFRQLMKTTPTKYRLNKEYN